MDVFTNHPKFLAKKSLDILHCLKSYQKFQISNEYYPSLVILRLFHIFDKVANQPIFIRLDYASYERNYN